MKSKFQNPKLINLKEKFFLIVFEDHNVLGSTRKLGTSNLFSMHGF